MHERFIPSFLSVYLNPSFGCSLAVVWQLFASSNNKICEQALIIRKNKPLDNAAFDCRLMTKTILKTEQYQRNRKQTEIHDRTHGRRNLAGEWV